MTHESVGVVGGLRARGAPRPAVSARQWLTRELQFSKTWLVTLGDQDDIATRLKFRAGIDTITWRSYAR